MQNMTEEQLIAARLVESMIRSWKSVAEELDANKRHTHIPGERARYWDVMKDIKALERVLGMLREEKCVPHEFDMGVNGKLISLEGVEINDCLHLLWQTDKGYFGIVKIDWLNRTIDPEGLSMQTAIELIVEWDRMGKPMKNN